MVSQQAQKFEELRTACLHKRGDHPLEVLAGHLRLGVSFFGLQELLIKGFLVRNALLRLQVLLRLFDDDALFGADVC